MRFIADTATRPTATQTWIVGGVALAMFFTMLVALQILGDGDTWWHVRAGEWILDHRAVPHLDPFAGSRPALPWVAHEWLSEALLALAYRAAGWSGVMALSAAAGGLALLLLGRHLAKHVSGWTLLVVLALVFGLLSAGLLARPHILALPLLVVWTAGLLAARDADAAPSLLLLPAMVLWANLHGGFAFGLALIGPFALEALVAAAPAARGRVVQRWGAFGIAALLAATATPHGPGGLLFPVQLLQMSSLSLIGEWKPAVFAGLVPLEVALLALLGVALSVRVRVPPVRLLVLLGLVHMALHQGRHEVLLGIVGAMLLARPLAKGLALSPQHDARLPAGRALVALLTAVLVLLVWRLTSPVVRVDGPMAPIAAIAAVPAELRAKPVLNAYAFGGYLIWSGIAPSIDGRADMYGDARMFAHARVAGGDKAALAQQLSEHGVAWTIFAPEQRVVATLDELPGWKRLFADAVAVVHVRVTQ